MLALFLIKFLFLVIILSDTQFNRNIYVRSASASKEKENKSFKNGGGGGIEYKTYHQTDENSYVKADPESKDISKSEQTLESYSSNEIKRYGHVLKNSFPLHKNTQILKADDEFPAPDKHTCPWPVYECNEKDKYRSIDGSCNNLCYPLWGRSFIPLSRHIAASYSDGVKELRKSFADGSPLPSGRKISHELHSNQSLSMPSLVNTCAVMSYGQFHVHDLSHTAVSKRFINGEKVDADCGIDNCLKNTECEPIELEEDDFLYTNNSSKCIKFIRSQETPNLKCETGSRQQINEITSFIDASTIYGSRKSHSDTLRHADKSRGQMNYITDMKHGPFLPLGYTDGSCIKHNDNKIKCFDSGDKRVNEQVILISYHTLFLREHNRIENELYKLHGTKWTGEKYFQESRKIMAAIMQHITYNEYLPIVLGNRAMLKYNLKLLTNDAFYFGYDATCKPSIFNEFSTAAFRFGHSTIPDLFFLRNNRSALRFSEMFFKPTAILKEGATPYVLGSINNDMKSAGCHFSNQLRNHMFTKRPPHGRGLDLPAINTQRGRDHGLAPYNDYREFCGLKRARNWDDFVEISREKREILKGLYKHVNDVDLFTGAMAENLHGGGLVGPTFNCLIGKQYESLRKGDRFWYENYAPDSSGFTKEQLKELRKVTLASIVCMNTKAEKIQPLVLQKPFRETCQTVEDCKRLAVEDGHESDVFYKLLWESDFNSKILCGNIPQMEFRAWENV